MRYSTQVKSISYLKANAAEMLQTLAELREPVLITQNGEAKAVLQDVASYEELQETLALLKLLALASTTAMPASWRRSMKPSTACSPASAAPPRPSPSPPSDRRADPLPGADRCRRRA